MTNSTKLIGLIMTATLWAGVAVAQGPTSNWGDDIPPDMTLPSPHGSDAANMATTQPYDDADSSGFTEGLPGSQADCYEYGADLDVADAGGFWGQAAPIESTGTWLRRGFWYVETDAVVMTRIWTRDDKRLVAQDENVNNPPVNNASLGFNPVFLDTNRLLILNSSLPGRDASVRATLGNFLFRDSRNRDHSAEFTVFGGGNWNQERLLESETPNELFVPFMIDGGNRSFDESTRQTVQYRSNLNSYEANYRVRGRLGHDQLVMDANGQWHRSANAGIERDYLIGLRFLQIDERLDWRAEDIIVQGDDGSYKIRTSNDLFGLQAGTGWTYQAPRWSLGANIKGGVFLNDALGESQLNFTADDTSDADLRLRENQLSFVGEFGMQGKYHVMPNVSLRAGYNLMFMTSLALAPNQATFITDYSYLNTTGGPFYHGATAGVDFFW